MDVIHPGIVDWSRVVQEHQMAKGVQRKYEVWSMIMIFIVFDYADADHFCTFSDACKLQLCDHPWKADGFQPCWNFRWWLILVVVMVVMTMKTMKTLPSFLWSKIFWRKYVSARDFLIIFYQFLVTRARYLGKKQDPDAGLDLAVDEGSHLVLAQEGEGGHHGGVPHPVGEWEGDCGEEWTWKFHRDLKIGNRIRFGNLIVFFAHFYKVLNLMLSKSFPGQNGHIKILLSQHPNLSICSEVWSILLKKIIQKIGHPKYQIHDPNTECTIPNTKYTILKYAMHMQAR